MCEGFNEMQIIYQSKFQEIHIEPLFEMNVCALYLSKKSTLCLAMS